VQKIFGRKYFVISLVFHTYSFCLVAPSRAASKASGSFFSPPGQLASR
jgi:hypothetical protein